MLSWDQLKEEIREKVPKKIGAEIFGKFFNEELDDNKHTVKQVKAIIELFPESLSQVDRIEILPIQNAAMRAVHRGCISVSFVPLMAREGCRLGVGGEGNRGGLLSTGKYTRGEAIKCLAGRTFKKGPGANEYDRKLAQVLKELRNLNM
eukprot:521121_1